MNYKPILPQHLSSEYQKSENLRRMADAGERHLEEVGAIRSELKKTRNEFADFKAQQAEQRKADAVQAQVDKKKQRRHEYLVAAFTVALTLFIEHFFDVVKLMQVAFETLIALLK